MSSNSNINESQSSTLDSENQEKRLPEKLFAQIIEFLEEYTTEKAEVLLKNKSKLLSILKTHRPLKTFDYQFGLTTNLIKNRCLIVFEWDNKKMVRQYYKHWGAYMWRCLTCERLYDHQLRSTRFYIFLVNGIVFVPIGHDCKPRDYDTVMQQQKFLEEGNAHLARRMSQLVNFTYGESSLANIINVLGNVSATLLKKRKTDNDQIIAKTSADLKRKSKDDDYTSSLANSSPVQKKIKTDNKTPHESRTSSNQISEKETTQIPTTTFSFQKPSILALQKICNKLDIKFCKEAMQFWKEIKFNKINTLSTNIRTQKFKEKNFYKILSNFFTGKFCDYEQIYFAINSAFRDKLVEEGEMAFDEIDLLCSTSYTVTEKHLKFMTKFLPCRILIFDSNNENAVKKYGKWKNSDNSNVLTLVLSFSKRKYSVVVDL